MTVYLVGAGPGDPELMTKRSLGLITAADVIIADRRTPNGALIGARADARLISAGKKGEQVAQAEIDRLLVEHGKVAALGREPKIGAPAIALFVSPSDGR